MTLRKMKEIEFINYSEYENILSPVPASSMLPEWYKKMPGYVDKSHEQILAQNGKTKATIKKCMPVFDSLTSGYLFLLGADLEITHKNGSPYFAWPALNLITFHPKEQLATYPGIDSAAPKLESYFGFKTPLGYSCLFMPPVHRENVIEIFTGIVDTDTYHNTVNFPFKLKDPTFTGLIPRGTPVAQIIPFRRDSWKSSVTKKKREDRKFFDYVLDTVFANGYKNMFWKRKEYK